MNGSSEARYKSEWRKRMREIRDSLPQGEREVKSRILCEHTMTLIVRPLRMKLGRPLNLCVYASFRSEADPGQLIETALAEGDRLAAPRILPNAEGMELRRVEALTSWISGRWGVPEPDPDHTDVWDSSITPDIVLVPGLAFNELGGRLGYGGGYYDRLYARLLLDDTSQTLWVGFAYSNQIVAAELPTEAHDLRLDGLATDDGIRWFRDPQPM